MTIRIHHLNCGTMCPFCQRLTNGGSWIKPGRMVCHCLLVETDAGLILVDAGLGTLDVQDPVRRLGRSFVTAFRPQLKMEETALYQIRALGFDPHDVRHICPTHLDLDHAGGLSDFPWAAVHIYRPELKQLDNPGFRERMRFRAAHFEHQPKWAVHEGHDKKWFEIEVICPIPELKDELVMVPLIGHTRGHVGIAVKGADKWILHCGDAYFHRSQVTDNPDVPIGLGLFEKTVQTLGQERIFNQKRLQALALQYGDEIEMICAHDPVEFARYQS